MLPSEAGLLSLPSPPPYVAVREPGPPPPGTPPPNPAASPLLSAAQKAAPPSSPRSSPQEALTSLRFWFCFSRWSVW